MSDQERKVSYEEDDQEAGRTKGREDVAQEVEHQETHEEEVRHVVLFSGGIGSWAAAKRVAERHGTEGLVLLFTDTKTEDEDTYRFLREGAENVGGRLVWISEGRTIWEVFEDRNFLSNTRVDHCSQYLKREQSRRWIRENCRPEVCTVYVGIDWSESHRFTRLGRHWKPYRVEAPMTEAPYLTKQDVIAWAESEGIRNQRLYEQGFKHANCSGFCVKMGHGQAAHLLRERPEVFAKAEAFERGFRERTGKDQAFLRDRSGGTSKPLPLSDLRKRVEAEQPIDELDWGACACVDPSEDEIA